MQDPNVFLQLMGGQYTNPWNCAVTSASASGLVKSCGVMGNFFANEAATEREALGLPINGKITVFRPQFVNTMNAAASQMSTILINYIAIRAAAATMMAATLKPDSQQANWINDLLSELKTFGEKGRASATQPVLSPAQVLQTYSAGQGTPPNSDQPPTSQVFSWVTTGHVSLVIRPVD